LEVGVGGTGAFVPECPGCWVFGRSPERALEKVKITVAEWFRWLKVHGEPVPDVRGFDVKWRRFSGLPIIRWRPESLNPYFGQRCFQSMTRILRGQFA